MSSAYYVARIFYGGQQVEEVTAVVGTDFADGDWTTPAFERGLQEQIVQIIAAHAESSGAENA
ncbi:hypothetical protein MXD59_01585 [Frankia sp. Ag45/Mut15]|uniref:Uncharacterized protein n=1 Tax=Frankia umida TaxID=573489 RepID=A0ABT0JSI0_9ACTN|nr:hypothetical protein [Frankia umida]MCK9874484.1 hypothetical protein [Frankia umida]